MAHTAIVLADPAGLGGASFPKVVSIEDHQFFPESEISGHCFEGIIGKSSAIKKLREQVCIVAPTDCTVLLHGETGTGKELVARAIHNLSSRRGRDYVRMNCAAIPSGLLESELFGHERGAFTGALMQRKGRFELADGGSLFLDEVGDISLELQPKLLRAIQEQEFERLGSAKTIQVDVRLIAATHRDLPAMIQEEKFRSDLFYRFNVFPIEIPPLRERREDIPLLVNHFVRQFAARMKRSYESAPSGAIMALCEYDWPGNIRELQNLIERAVILSPGPVLRVPLRDLRRRTIAVPHTGHQQTLEEAERAHILRTLKETNWVLSGPHGAATRLALHRSTLQFRMKKLGIVHRHSFEDGASAAPESGAQ